MPAGDASGVHVVIVSVSTVTCTCEIMLEREYDRPRLMAVADALLCGLDRLMLPEAAAVASLRVREADVELRLRIAGRLGRVVVFGDWE